MSRAHLPALVPAALALVFALSLASAARAFLPPAPGATSREADARLGRRALSGAADATARGAGGREPTLRRGASGAHAVVLLVDFADSTWADPARHSLAYFDSVLFHPGAPSVRTYYEEISGGRFALSGEIHPVRRLPVSIAGYTGDGQCPGCCCGTGPYPSNAQRMVEDLVRASDAAVDFSRHDGDGDGVVDVVFVVHAGIGVEDRPVPRQFSSHQWHTVERPRPDGVDVRGYALLSEHSGIGAFAHEMAHLFGAVDLWDLDGSSMGLGSWSLMAQGARLGTPVDANPAHPDAWTRLRLGFAEPIDDPFPGVTGTRTLGPVESGGAILRLRPGNAEGLEYFLVENRQTTAVTFDAALPGEGLLIYHVDERVPTNRNEPRYRVALEQADGRFDLEFPRFLDLFGDAGDPFPGDSARTVFNASSLPAARTHDGAPFGVSLAGIAEVGTDVRFDLSLASGPLPVVVEISTREASGDGDLRLDPGEEVFLDLTIENRGLATGAPVTLVPTVGGGAAVRPAEVEIGPLDAEQRIEVEGVFVVTAPPAFETNPLAVPIGFAFTGVGEPSEHRLVAGDRFGLEASSFEAEIAPFRSERIGFGVADPWHRSSARARNGAFAMKCGDDSGGDYPDSIDAALVTPPVLLGAGSRLLMSHWIFAETQPSDDVIGSASFGKGQDAFDGARVEVSTNGTTWSVLEPEDGYTHDPVPGATFWLFDHRVFGGFSGLRPGCEDGWCDEAFDLSAYDGRAVDIRFRFASDRDVPGQRLFEGWYVDAVRVETDGSPVAFHLFDADVTADPFEIEWTIVPNLEPFHGRVRLERSREGVAGGGAPVVLFDGVVTAPERRVAGDAPFVPGERRRYSLVTGDGGPDSVRAARVLARPALPARPGIERAGPLPFRPDAGLFFVGLGPSSLSRASLRVHDASGRLVAERDGVRAADGRFSISWDGTRGNGARAPAGVYFFTVPGARGASGRIVLLR